MSSKYIPIRLGKGDEKIAEWLKTFPRYKKSYALGERMEKVLKGDEKGPLKYDPSNIVDQSTTTYFHYNRSKNYELTNRYVNYLKKHTELGKLSSCLKQLLNGVILDSTGEWRLESAHIDDTSDSSNDLERNRRSQKPVPPIPAQTPVEEVHQAISQVSVTSSSNPHQQPPSEPIRESVHQAEEPRHDLPSRYQERQIHEEIVELTKTAPELPEVPVSRPPEIPVHAEHDEPQPVPVGESGGTRELNPMARSFGSDKLRRLRENNL